MSENIIPAIWAAGSFVAAPPFDVVVNPKTYYTVEGTRTISEMLAEKENLFNMVFAPAGITQEDFQGALDAAIAANAVIITLTTKGRAPVHIPSTALKSFPLVDGVIYERLCFIADLGAVPPSLKDRVNSGIEHFKNYIKDSLGIADATVTIGTVPLRGYVSKEQAEVWENTRKNAITKEPSDRLQLETANKTILALRTYIAELEASLEATKKE